MKAIDPKAKKSFIIAGAMVASIIVVSSVFFILMKNNVHKNDSNVKIPGVDNAQEIDKGNKAANPTEAYSGMSKKLDSENASQAATTGSSFVPTFAPPPESVSKSVEPPVSGQPVPGGEQAQNYQSVVNNYGSNNNIQNQAQQDALKNFDSKMKRIGELAKTFQEEGYSSVKESSSWQKTDTTNASSAVLASSTANASSTMLVKTGERVYISIDTAINTDEPSPVLATILSGNASGMTMFGVVHKNQNDTISLEFTTLALPSGKSVAISAFAVDPATGRTAVSGSVDHKIFERFVLPAFAAGLGAYGQIVSMQGQQITTAPMAGTSTVVQNLSPQQITAVGLGAGASNIATTLSNNAQAAKPAVSTNRDLGLEVIFMKELIVPK
jgi:intracellular multiplication protein IcmE